MNSKSYKYFKYAIGEVVLIVIGILIALQLNNWNEQKKKDSTKQVYLARLNHDLSRDTANLQLFIDRSEILIKIYRIKAKQIEKRGIPEDSVGIFLNLIFPNLPYKNQNKTTFQSLMSIGDIELFHGENAIMLMDFYSTTENNENIIIQNRKDIESSLIQLRNSLGLLDDDGNLLEVFPVDVLESNSDKKLLKDYLYHHSNLLYNNKEMAHYMLVRSKDVLKVLNKSDDNHYSDIISF